MAVISFVMDEGIDKCNAARRILYDEISGQSTNSEQRVEKLTNLFTLITHKRFMQTRMTHFAPFLSLFSLVFGGRKEASRNLSFE